MKFLLFFISFLFGINNHGFCDDQADSLKKMVQDIQEAVHSEKNVQEKAEALLKEKCDMKYLSIQVALKYIRTEKNKQPKDKQEEFVDQFVKEFSPILASYLTRLYTTKTNLEIFKDYELTSCTVDNGQATLAFKNKKDETQKAWCILNLSDKGLIRGIKIGKDRQNMLDIVKATRITCEEIVSKQGKKPQDIFKAQKN